MTDARLEARRENSEPKCANCGHWGSRDTDFRIGKCGNVSIVDLTTLDLAVCTAWKLHEVHTGRIMKDDEAIEE